MSRRSLVGSAGVNRVGSLKSVAVPSTMLNAVTAVPESVTGRPNSVPVA
jgi:hypothetical protein